MSRTDDTWAFATGDAITSELTAMRLLGGGAAYEAYLAFDELTYGPVVVKLVRPAQVGDETTLRGLAREAEALDQVNHPAVVRRLRAELAGDRPHVVLEHLEGPRLSTLIRRYGPLEPAQYLPLGIEVAAALHHLHRIGLTHLDVKPSNVIMGAPAKLIDLSVARPAAAAAQLTYPVGTDAYMAPEQCRPGPGGAPGPASDVWGLGATLFEAIAGFRAIPEGDARSDNPGRRFPQLVELPLLPPGGTPPEVADVVMRCLAEDPQDRPAPAEVVDVLAPVLGSQPRGKLGAFKAALAR